MPPGPQDLHPLHNPIDGPGEAPAQNQPDDYGNNQHLDRDVNKDTTPDAKDRDADEGCVVDD